MWFASDVLWRLSALDLKRAAHSITSMLLHESEAELSTPVNARAPSMGLGSTPTAFEGCREMEQGRKLRCGKGTLLEGQSDKDGIGSPSARLRAGNVTGDFDGKFGHIKVPLRTTYSGHIRVAESKELGGITSCTKSSSPKAKAGISPSRRAECPSDICHGFEYDTNDFGTTYLAAMT